MSNRSLLEINHDYAGDIERNPEQFMTSLQNYLRCACDQTRDELYMRYGVTVKHLRHHSDECPVDAFKGQQKK